MIVYCYFENRGKAVMAYFKVLFCHLPVKFEEGKSQTCRNNQCLSQYLYQVLLNTSKEYSCRANLICGMCKYWYTELKIIGDACVFIPINITKRTVVWLYPYHFVFL